MENLIREPFTSTKLEGERDKESLVFTIRLNLAEQETLKQARQLLRQPKDSTAFKELAAIGYQCITRPETKAIIETIFNNNRKNKRTGFSEIE